VPITLICAHGRRCRHAHLAAQPARAAFS